jgi:hypothetical protein
MFTSCDVLIGIYLSIYLSNYLSNYPSIYPSIASDVIYDPSGYCPLFISLCAILSRGGRVHESVELPDINDDKDNKDNNNIELKDIKLYQNESFTPPVICILAHRHRHPEDAKFFKLLSNEPNLVVKIVLEDKIRDVTIYHLYYSILF